MAQISLHNNKRDGFRIPVNNLLLWCATRFKFRESKTKNTRLVQRLTGGMKFSCVMRYIITPDRRQSKNVHIIDERR